MTRPALAFSGMSAELGGREVLAEISAEVPAGASVALLGPNGAGKSTLLRTVAGTVGPSSGSVRIGAGRVAFVPQRLEIEPAFPVTALDVVRMGRFGELGWWRRFAARDEHLVAEAIDSLEVGGLASRRFGDLSGGERQRVLLAQALAQDADLLLLDEPFTGVDRPTHESLRRLLRRWSQEGRTTIVATHDLESAVRDFDLVMCLNRRLVAYGPAAATCTEPVLAETFAGHVVRVGELLIDTAHHHHGAG